MGAADMTRADLIEAVNEAKDAISYLLARLAKLEADRALAVGALQEIGYTDFSEEADYSELGRIALSALAALDAQEDETR
jgi:hypothetical protein